MEIYYTEEDKAKMRTINIDYINGLKMAIKNNQIDQYLNSFGIRPRYQDILDIILCYPDCEAILGSFYEYLIVHLKNIHLATAIKKISDYPSIQKFLVRDFKMLLDRVTEHIIVFYDVCHFVQGMLKNPESEKLVLANFDTILKNTHPTLVYEMLILFKDKPYFKSMFKDNFDKYIEYSLGSCVLSLFSLMFEIDEKYTILYIKNNFAKILKHLGGGNIYLFIDDIMKYPELIEFVKKNIDIVISNANAYDVENIVSLYDEKYDLKLTSSQKILALIKDKLNDEKASHLAISAIIKSQCSDHLLDIINKLMVEEQVSDFTSIGDKSWSNLVFKIGSKVLKIGWVRNNPNCPDHYRIINPDYSEIIKDENGNNAIYIETYPNVNQEGITDMDMQNFYDDLDKDGLIYVDPQGKNVVNFGWLPDGTRISNYDKCSESFKRRKVVLIDRDCVWKKGDPNINYMICMD